MITTYDIPLDWYNEDFAYRSPIHPIVKKPVGEKMRMSRITAFTAERAKFPHPFIPLSVRKTKKMILTFENAENLKTANGLPPSGSRCAGKTACSIPPKRRSTPTVR